MPASVGRSSTRRALVAAALLVAVAACGGGETDGVASTPAASPAPTPTPPPGRIAFVRHVSGAESLWILDVATGAETKVVDGPVSSPSWSPDGRSLAFARGVQIYAIDVDGTDERPIYPGGGDNRYPAWLPDGRIAYLRAGGGGSGGPIYIDGVVFFDQYCCLDRPAATPDGRAVLVNWCVQGRLGFHRVDLTTAAATPVLLAEDAGYSFPAYSPDGSRIAFTRYSRGSDGLWVASAAGGAPTRLTGPAADYQATWSPDGRRVAFHRILEAGHRFDVMVVNADGSGLATLLTNALGPAWGR